MTEPTNTDKATAEDLLKKLERSNDAWINARGEIEELKKRLEPIHNVWGRWKDFHRTSYPTIEHTIHALNDFGDAIAKSMIGYNK
jgi:hypothetical protein